MKIERKENQIILKFEPKNNETNCCSICSSGKIGNHPVKPITMDSGIIAYLLATRIGGKQYCMKCSMSIKNISNRISKKYVVATNFVFHTVKLVTYTHWIDPFKKEHLYLKPDSPFSVEYYNSVIYNPRFQFEQHPYSLPEYSNWEKTVKAYEADLDREKYALENLHDQVFLFDKNKDLYLEEGEKRFFINLSERLEREERWRKEEEI